ncbi:MAG: hypothetical protein QW104_07000 [Nitrososphaerota archaeon]
MRFLHLKRSMAGKNTRQDAKQKTSGNDVWRKKEEILALLVLSTSSLGI